MMVEKDIVESLKKSSGEEMSSYELINNNEFQYHLMGTNKSGTEHGYGKGTDIEECPGEENCDEIEGSPEFCRGQDRHSSFKKQESRESQRFQKSGANVGQSVKCEGVIMASNPSEKTQAG
jgi:hypothetical protein